jgi:hypothetical protein
LVNRAELFEPARLTKVVAVRGKIAMRFSPVPADSRPKALHQQLH